MKGLEKKIKRAKGELITSCTPARVLTGVQESTGEIIPVPELVKRISLLAQIVTDTAKKHLPTYWNEEGFGKFQAQENFSFAYKAVEKVRAGQALEITSPHAGRGRSRRMAGEILGRQIRAGIHRKKIFDGLKLVQTGDVQWKEAPGERVEKRNMSRQVARFVRKTGSEPKTFFEMVPTSPEHIKPIIPLSSTDEQQCQWLGVDDTGTRLKLRVLLPPCTHQGKWNWCVLHVGVDSLVIAQYLAGNTELTLPTVRVKQGRVLADITLDEPTPQKFGDEFTVLGLDWGLRRLLTGVVLRKDESGNVTYGGRDFLFKAGRWHEKDRLRRVEGERLYAKAARVAALAGGRVDGHLNKQGLEQKSEKLLADMQSMSGKRARANRELGKLAAVLAVSWAQMSYAGIVAVEALDSLEPVAGNKKHKARLSQRIRGQVKKALVNACKKQGLDLCEVNAQNTSSICPECPETSWLRYGKLKRLPTSGYNWARCLQCGKSWDRDVVGATNVGARYLRDKNSGKRVKKTGHIRGAGVKDLGGVKRVRSGRPKAAPKACPFA